MHVAARSVGMHQRTVCMGVRVRMIVAVIMTVSVGRHPHRVRVRRRVRMRMRMGKIMGVVSGRPR